MNEPNYEEYQKRFMEMKNKYWPKAKDVDVSKMEVFVRKYKGGGKFD